MSAGDIVLPEIMSLLNANRPKDPKYRQIATNHSYKEKGGNYYAEGCGRVPQYLLKSK